MRWTGLVLAVSLALWPPLAVAEPENCSRDEPSGERTLCHAMVVDGGAEEVWRLFATSEGLASWLAPVAAIDARTGGLWETSYDRNRRLGEPGNIRNRVIAILPGRLLAIQIADAPLNFPHADLARQLATAIEFEALADGRTRVRVTMTGYRVGEGYDALYRHFNWGNAQTLEALAVRLRDGPKDWSAPQ